MKNMMASKKFGILIRRSFYKKYIKFLLKNIQPKVKDKNDLFMLKMNLIKVLHIILIINQSIACSKKVLKTFLVP